MELSNVESLLNENTLVLQRIYTGQLFIIGVLCAVFVCWLLYSFIKKFY